MAFSEEQLQWKSLIEEAYRNRSLLTQSPYVSAIHHVLEALDRGQLRVANPPSDENHGADWQVNTWIKEAILLFFSVQKMQTFEVGPFEFHDKIPLKKNLAEAGVRVVPPGVIRYGAHAERSVVIMPGYVNIGAFVGAGTMVDTWATVGSCAQIGQNVHLSGGVGIGGVLEPPGARPVIIEDGAFIGSRAIVVEGVRVGKEAVIGAGVVLTASTVIIDVTKETAVESKGFIPPRSVVIPGSRAKQFAAGTYHVPCALIVGVRSASTDQKVSLNQALRDFDVQV